MHKFIEEIQRLQAVHFRNSGFKRKRILTPDQEILFQNFLIRALGQNVFIISTGIGLDIYYLADKKFTSFIKDNLWLFKKEPSQEDKTMLFMQELNGDDVVSYFNEVVTTLSNHPQLFLSCSKKLIHKFNIQGTNTTINTLLYSCFSHQITRLEEAKKLPFPEKINALRKKDKHIHIDIDLGLRKLLNQYSIENHNN